MAICSGMGPPSDGDTFWWSSEALVLQKHVGWQEDEPDHGLICN